MTQSNGVARPGARAMLLALAVGFWAGCGARSGELGEPIAPQASADAGAEESAATDSGNDVAVYDAGADAPVDAADRDAGLDATVFDAQPDAEADGATDDAGADADASDQYLVDLHWAQWPMPNSLAEVEAGAPSPQSYTDNGDGTVTDNVTMLMWEQTPVGSDGGAYPLFREFDDAGPSATDHCASLELAGYQDWRLATLVELVSILDYSIALPGPMIDTSVFPDTPGANFWSSTPVLPRPVLWRYARFDVGNTGSEFVGDVEYARCVRGGGPGPFAPVPLPAAQGRYVAAGSGEQTTVLDTKTKLIWQVTPALDGGAFPLVHWEDAHAYCASLQLAGTGGYRLPTIRELLTLSDYSPASPTVPVTPVDPTFFPGTPQLNFWSSTTMAGHPDMAWTVQTEPGQGIADVIAKSDIRNFRCVR